jgi:ribose 5-phosphate isomerase B
VHYNGTLRSVITEREIPEKGELRVAAGALITPLAREAANARGVKIIEISEEELARQTPPERTIAIGSDHGGFRMKEALKPILIEAGLVVRDVGVDRETPVDYPDIALKVAEMVASGAAARGVILDGAGIGSAMAANKVPGVRAALCYDRSTARNSREHNDSNVLTLGGRLLTTSQAEDVLRTWLATPFAGGRHTARIQKITAIEQRYSQWTRPNSSNS